MACNLFDTLHEWQDKRRKASGRFFKGFVEPVTGGSIPARRDVGEMLTFAWRPSRFLNLDIHHARRRATMLGDAEVNVRSVAAGVALVWYAFMLAISLLGCIAG